MADKFKKSRETIDYDIREDFEDDDEKVANEPGEVLEVSNDVSTLRQK